MKHTSTIVFLSIILISVYFIVNFFSYWDPSSLCYISIDGVALGGNTKTIHQAIVLLKKEDREGYQTLCRWVDRINERACRTGDWVLNPSRPGSEARGCYIRGSRIIYVKPEESASEAVVRQRAEVIKKYAQYSKQFWDGLE